MNVTEKYWSDNPKLIKTFQTHSKYYEQLCFEVKFILENCFKEAEIEFSHVASRCKTLDSFLEKQERKQYKDPFKEITDFAGVRIVILYKDDLSEIERLIRKKFRILETVDKVNDVEFDQFGYEAIHYIVKLNSGCKGDRYDKLKKFVCEIQVRTILQDAWANVAHHLIYKTEKDVPKQLNRKLYRLVGLFETADEQFAAIRNERVRYIQELGDSVKILLDEEMNLDSLCKYCKWKFPKKQLNESALSQFLSKTSVRSYKRVRDIDTIVDRESAAIDQYNQSKVLGHWAYSSSLINIAVACDNEKFFKENIWGKEAIKIIANNKKWNDLISISTLR